MLLPVGLADLSKGSTLMALEDESGLITPQTCPKCWKRDTLMGVFELLGMRMEQLTARVMNGIGQSPLEGESDRGSTAISSFPRFLSWTSRYSPGIITRATGLRNNLGDKVELIVRTLAEL